MKATQFISESIRAEKDWRIDPEVLQMFPQIVPKVMPLGARILCQLISTKKTTSSGIFLVEETKETDRWNNQVARVLAVGPLAFCNRDTGEPWKEGTWAEPGDFVIVPRWGGNRRTMKDPKGEEAIHLVTVNDHEVLERVYGNPLELETYIL
jgi:co-chaperonin GroES (HSP10)